MLQLCNLALHLQLITSSAVPSDVAVVRISLSLSLGPVEKRMGYSGANSNKSEKEILWNQDYLNSYSAILVQFSEISGSQPLQYVL